MQSGEFNFPYSWKYPALLALPGKDWYYSFIPLQKLQAQQ